MIKSAVRPGLGVATFLDRNGRKNELKIVFHSMLHFPKKYLALLGLGGGRDQTSLVWTCVSAKHRCYESCRCCQEIRSVFSELSRRSAIDFQDAPGGTFNQNRNVGHGYDCVLLKKVRRDVFVLLTQIFDADWLSRLKCPPRR